MKKRRNRVVRQRELEYLERKLTAKIANLRADVNGLVIALSKLSPSEELE